MANIISIHDGAVTEYEHLFEALQNLEDGCKLIFNVDSELDQTVYVDGMAVTFDLNGHNIIPSHNSDTVVVYGSGHFILQDTSETGSGIFYSNSSCIDLGANNNYAGPNSFTMYSGNIIAQEFGVAIFGGGVVNVHGGSIKGKDNAAIGANGSKKYSEYPYEINITDGELIGETQSSGYANCGLYAANAGVVNISGGYINGVDGAGIVIRGGSVNISGGVVQGSGSTEGKRMGDANPTYCGGVEICNAANYPGKIEECVISGGTIVSKHNSAALVIGDPNNPDYPNSINSSVVITGGEFNGINSVGFITKQGQAIDETQNANLIIYGGTFNSDVSNFLDDSLHLEKVVKEDGTIVYQVAKTISDVITEIQEVEDQLLQINNVEVQQATLLDDIQSKQEILNTSVNSIDNSIDSIVSGISTSLENEGSILASIDSSNSKLDKIDQTLGTTNLEVSEISSTSTNIKSDTTSIKSTTNVISNTVDTVSDSLENLIKVNKKIFEAVSKINGDDPADTDPETSKDEKSIEILQIKNHVADCKITGQKAFIWNHKLSDNVKEYCESKRYSIIKPEYLGGQYLIIMPE